MKNIQVPTAEEFLLKDKNYEELHLDYPKLSKAIQESMIEFAKLHVKAALKAASATLPYDDRMNQSIVDTIAIEKSYPLENIK